MASTYSPLLRYELISAGEQAGIWGNTANVNIGSLIEQSVAGVTTISGTSLGGSTYVLESLNGAPDEARSMVLNFTGSAASTFTVIVPTSQKLYVVRNNTGQTINFKTAAQVTPQAVDTANSTMIFCDGTDVLPGIAAPSVGTLLVSGGGTGATTFTAGFVKSPGGTTALTSSASISLTADVSGTLPVANGGTGVATVTAGRLLLGNGTSPFNSLAGTTTGGFVAWNGTSWAEAVLLGTTRGGTGLSTYSTGQILYASGIDTLAKLNIGTTGQVLTVSGGVPAWATPSASSGTVTSVNGSGGTTGLTFSGGPITTSGTLTLSGTLAAANGGTGATSLTGAGIVTLSATQTITGDKTFTGQILNTAYNYTATGTSTYTLADGTGTTVEVSTKNSASTSSTKLIIGSGGTSGGTYQGQVRIGAVTLPTANNALDLGTSGLVWKDLYVQNSPIVVSDARLKTDIQNSALGLSFINALRPVSYRFVQGKQEEDGTYTETALPNGNTRRLPNYRSVAGMRVHYGLLAQEVKTAVDAAGIVDFAGWGLLDKNDPSSQQQLRYEEFISPLIKAVQELTAEVTSLKARIELLEG